MNTAPTVFGQVINFLPLHEFRKCVKRCRGDYKIKRFSCLDQFLCMAFAQLTFGESPRHRVLSPFDMDRPDIDRLFSDIQFDIVHTPGRLKTQNMTVKFRILHGSLPFGAILSHPITH